MKIKNQHVLGLITFLVIGIVLMSGCINEQLHSVGESVTVNDLEMTVTRYGYDDSIKGGRSL
ncbi:MAG: hypothetical protein U9Q22_05460 [Candidatus Altiarchaeota archaeon]|nr:hypothetical protein [Candidatus Altiarchaeota archaeon]